MNYDRSHVLRYYAGLTPDSRPCAPGICPLMVVYPEMRRMADATRADPELVRALDGFYKARYPIVQGFPPWVHFTAGDILAVVESFQP